MSDKRMVVVHVVSEETKARVEIGFLRSRGIEAQILEDDAGDQIPSLESTQGIKILVSDEQAELARTLIRERESND